MGVVFVFGDGSFSTADVVVDVFGVVVGLVLVGDSEYPPLHACWDDA